MHILADDEPTRECEECHKRTTRKLYGANNIPLCNLCIGIIRRRAVERYGPRIREKPVQAIDAWKPGDPV